MKPLLTHLLDKLLNDEMFVRRWLRAGLFTVAGTGFAFADQIGALVAEPALVKWLKIAAVLSGGVAAAINLGEKNS
jgi:hypothetical protein